MIKPEGFRCVAQLRWLSLQSTLRKRYLAIVRALFRAQQRLPKHLNLLGLVPGRPPVEITLVLQELLWLSSQFCGYSVIVGSKGIASAFGRMRRSPIEISPRTFGASPSLIHAVLRELIGLRTSQLQDTPQSLPLQLAVRKGGGRPLISSTRVLLSCSVASFSAGVHVARGSPFQAVLMYRISSGAIIYGLRPAFGKIGC